MSLKSYDTLNSKLDVTQLRKSIYVDVLNSFENPANCFNFKM